jgi:hypothetical protein
MADEPVLKEKKDVLAMTLEQRMKYVLEIAKYYVGKVSPYDPDTTYVEPQSFEDTDWYLYSVCAKARKDASDFKRNTYAVWTLNISTGGLHHGHYDLSKNEIINKLNYKRNI